MNRQVNQPSFSVQWNPETNAGSLLLEDGAHSLKLRWPAVRISIGGRIHDRFLPVTEFDGRSQIFRQDGITVQISLTQKNHCFFKEVCFRSEKTLPTPEFADADMQSVPDTGLRSCGYRPECIRKCFCGGEEDGAGSKVEFGYPLIGEFLFTGLEHQAAFNRITARTSAGVSYILRQHPVWEKNQIRCCRAVLGMSSDPERSFLTYLQDNAAPQPAQPLFSFCTFWSDPYLKDCEYKVSDRGYSSYASACRQLKLRPDVITLDAGWQNRSSFYDAKTETGGNPWLQNFSRKLKKLGSGLSIWYSSNGPMGISPDFLRSQGIAVGSGNGVAYRGDRYGVLLDPKLEQALTDRLCQLAGPEYGVAHFKVDWDNECATAPEFAAKYPTANHVREGSINALNRIALAIRKANPKIVMRTGSHNSPWWIFFGSHVMLPDSGDCTYSGFPSRTQRDAAVTHRDNMYYCSYRRDHVQLPIRNTDNHEFPMAPRNIMNQDLLSWSNTVLMSILRGTTYLSYMIQPAALSPAQADFLRDVMSFARTHSGALYPWNTRMILGCPGKGEIYGFLHPGEHRSWCVLRNPAPDAQPVSLADISTSHKIRGIRQIYPAFQELEPDVPLVLLPHEVRILLFEDSHIPMPMTVPFQCQLCRGSVRALVPASFRPVPVVDQIYRHDRLAAETPQLLHEEGRTRILFAMESPYQMRDFHLDIRLHGISSQGLELKLYCSRYPLNDLDQLDDAYAVPVTVIPYGSPGGGEVVNPTAVSLSGNLFYTASLPWGGRACFSLEISRSGLSPENIRLSASGYEAPSPRSLPLPEAPLGFAACLPPPHPLGFPRFLEIFSSESIQSKKEA